MNGAGRQRNHLGAEAADLQGAPKGFSVVGDGAPELLISATSAGVNLWVKGSRNVGGLLGVVLLLTRLLSQLDREAAKSCW